VVEVAITITVAADSRLPWRFEGLKVAEKQLQGVPDVVSGYPIEFRGHAWNLDVLRMFPSIGSVGGWPCLTYSSSERPIQQT
jgi:hypothetical protein